MDFLIKKYKVNNTLKTLGMVILFVSISLLIVGNPFDGKMFFLLDMPWSDSFQWSDFSLHRLDPSALIYLILFLAHQLIGGFAVQKLLFILTITLAGYSMQKLSWQLFQSPGLALMSGLIYAISPVVTNRLMTGQWKILLGYALLPLVVCSLVRILQKFIHEKKTIPPKYFWHFLLLFCLLFIVSLHVWYMFSLVSIGIFILHFLMNTRNTISYLKKINKLYPSVLAVTLILQIIIASGLDSTNNQQFLNFDLLLPTNELLKQFLSLRAFWYDFDTFESQYLLFVSLIFLIMIIWYIIRNYRRSIAAFYLGALLSTIILAIGYSSSLTSHLTDVAMYIPGYSGLRETTKWLLVTSFLISIVLPSSIFFVTKKLTASRVQQKFLAVFLVIIFLSQNLYIFNQVQNQLGNYQYPNSWHFIKQKVTQNKIRTSLILPTNNYQVMHWADNRLLAMPTELFFDHATISSVELDSKSKQLDMHTSTDSISCDSINYYKLHFNIDSVIIINRIAFRLENCSNLQKIAVLDEIELYRIIN